MHPMIKEYVKILIRDKMWKHGDVVTGKLLAMSVGTVKNRVGNFLKARRKRTTSSSMSEESLSWMTVKILFQNGSHLLRES